MKSILLGVIGLTLLSFGYPGEATGMSGPRCEDVVITVDDKGNPDIVMCLPIGTPGSGGGDRREGSAENPNLPYRMCINYGEYLFEHNGGTFRACTRRQYDLYQDAFERLNQY